MKRLLILFTILFNLSALAQSGYPRYSVDSLGQKIVLLTVEQAIKLDNNSDLLALFEKMNAQIADYDSVCIKVIKDKDRVIGSQKMEISKLKESLSNKDAQIFALQKQVAEYVVRVNILEKEVENRQLVIDEKNLQIRGLKTKMLFGGIGGGAIILGLAGLVILIN